MSARRPGLTLLELQLALAVVFLLIAGALYGFHVRREQAGSAMARERLATAQIIVQQALATTGSAPVSGSGVFTRAWGDAHPDEKGQSPWGGATGDPTGVSEDAPLANAVADPAKAPDIGVGVATDPRRRGDLHYTSCSNAAGFVKVLANGQHVAEAFKGYVLAIYDQEGVPWLWVVGG